MLVLLFTTNLNPTRFNPNLFLFSLIIFIFFSVLSLFTVVKFQNQGCAASSGDNGTCLTGSECQDRGGVASGTCANGYGVCCLCE